DLPFRRQRAGRAERQRALSFHRRRRHVDRAHFHEQRGPASQALGPHRGHLRAFRPENRLFLHRRRRLGALLLGRRRQDLGSARQKPQYGLAPVLFRAPRGGPEKSPAPVQDEPQPHRQRRRRQELLGHERQLARRLA